MTFLAALALVLAPSAPSIPQDAAPPVVAEVEASYFTRPLYLGAAPPEVRALRNLTVVHVDVPGASVDVRRTRAEARALADSLRERVLEGADLAELAREHSGAPNARSGACLGSFPPGVLLPEVDAFLFAGEVGAVSEVVETASGFSLFERVEALAACRELLVAKERPDGERRARELLARARAGEDFAALAREHSDDPVTGPRGGALAIFERGPRDTLVKAAAFEALVGEVVGPVVSSKGWHVVQRVPLDALEPALREPTFVRARLLFVAHRDAPTAEPLADRTEEQAHELVRALHARVVAGEDLAALAAEYDDDRGGRARAGDLGWVHRRNPRNERMLERLFGVEAGHLFDPMPVRAGWVLLQRTR